MARRQDELAHFGQAFLHSPAAIATWKTVQFLNRFRVAETLPFRKSFALSPRIAFDALRDIVARHKWGKPMSRRPIGDTAMTVAERSRRKRAKAKALRDAAPKAAEPAIHSVPVSCTPTPSPAALDFLAGGPEAIAARIFDSVSVDTARGIAMALQQRLLQGGCWPTWRLPLM